MAELVPVYSVAQVRAAEKPLLEADEPLMARAAGALARIAAGEPALTTQAGGRVLVLAGSGDNGGDALFAAAQLASDGVTVDILRTSERVHEAALGAAVGAGARTCDLASAVEASGEYDVVLDGILGIGANIATGLRGVARTAVEALQRSLPFSRTSVIAVDVPSGLHPDDGTSDGCVLPASMTVTFGAVKAGLVVARGPELAGRVVLVDIGLGPGLAAVEPLGHARISRIVAG